MRSISLPELISIGGTVRKQARHGEPTGNKSADSLNGDRSEIRLNRMLVNPRKVGAGDRGRTGDVQLGKLAFYH